MKTARNQYPWALVVVVAVAALATGYGLGRHSSHQERREMQFIDWNGSRAQAEDAMRRWAPKAVAGATAHEKLERVRQIWSPRLMAYPTKNCIQLWPDDVGGAPIYCYRANSLELLEEHSDVE